jgi:hypothetical protein
MLISHRKMLDYAGHEKVTGASLRALERQARHEESESKPKILAVQGAFEALKAFNAALDALDRETASGPDKPVSSDTKEAFEAEKKVEKARVKLQQSEEHARKVVNKEA